MEFLCHKAYKKLDPGTPESSFDFLWFDGCEVEITCNANEKVKIFINSILSKD